MPHSILSILELWGFAFVTLGAALVLLNGFYRLVDGALDSHNLVREMILAGLVSLMEGFGWWLALGLDPVGGWALILPLLFMGVIYQVTHFYGWRRYEILWLLILQFALGGSGAMLLTGRFQAAAVILGIFAAILAATIGILRTL